MLQAVVVVCETVPGACCRKSWSVSPAVMSPEEEGGIQLLGENNGNELVQTIMLKGKSTSTFITEN